MTSKVSRRTFLVGGLAALGGAAAWWLAAGLRLPGHVDDLVVRILRRRLDFLTLNDADLRAFAADLVADRDSLQTRDVRLAALAFPLYPALPDGALDDPRVVAVEDEVVSRFLISTDFFWSGMDEATPVTYLGYYVPGRAACFNPFQLGMTASRSLREPLS